MCALFAGPCVAERAEHAYRSGSDLTCDGCSLAQLACCHRLQRLVSVQRQSLELAERLVETLRLMEEVGDQLKTAMDPDDSARRRYIGKLQQVSRAFHTRRVLDPNST